MLIKNRYNWTPVMISYFSVDTNNLSIQKLVAITQLYQRDHSFSTYVNQRNVCLRTK